MQTLALSFKCSPCWLGPLPFAVPPPSLTVSLPFCPPRLGCGFQGYTCGPFISLRIHFPSTVAILTHAFVSLPRGSSLPLVNSSSLGTALLCQQLTRALASASQPPPVTWSPVCAPFPSRESLHFNTFHTQPIIISHPAPLDWGGLTVETRSAPAGVEQEQRSPETTR